MVEPDLRNGPSPLRAARRRIALACTGVVALMIALSYAAIPIYQAFCRATGFDGATRIGRAAPGAVDGALFTIRFDANVAQGLPWRFKPAQRDMQVRPGEQKIAFYQAKNETGQITAGQAVYNVTPEIAGAYFVKIACFCFNEQHLGAHQSADMPVTFYVDPAILKDPDLKVIRTITLSYTFFPAAVPAKPQARAPQRDQPIRLGFQSGARQVTAN